MDQNFHVFSRGRRWRKRRKEETNNLTTFLKLNEIFYDENFIKFDCRSRFLFKIRKFDLFFVCIFFRFFFFLYITRQKFHDLILGWLFTLFIFYCRMMWGTKNLFTLYVWNWFWLKRNYTFVFFKTIFFLNIFCFSKMKWNMPILGAEYKLCKS